MEMVLNNGFCEMTETEMTVIEGGSEWYDVVGNIGFMGCAIGAAVLSGTPLGLVVLGATCLWGLH